jgi:hypothetical protein
MEQDDRAGGPSIVPQELYSCRVMRVVGEVEADLVGVLSQSGHVCCGTASQTLRMRIGWGEEGNRGSLPRVNAQLVLLALRGGAGRVSARPR